MSNSPHFKRDIHGRKPRYLRLSVTDRCNLKCAYCVSCERQRYIPHEKILRYEEFYRLAEIAKSLGTEKIRITGGEPFARKGIMDFMAGLRTRFPDISLAITTNATLIGPFLADLARLGLASINISLDSFEAESFAKITGSDLLPVVLDNIDHLLALGQRIKINAVAMAGFTDVQIKDFVCAARTMPLDIRFIEFMPMGSNTLWDKSLFISSEALYRKASRHARLLEEPHEELAGPAKMYSLENGKGRLGFISAVSNHFCATCNRLRITSEGRLRTCLFADAEADLSRLLRDPRISDEHIRLAMLHALTRKPLGSDILAAKSATAVAGRQMVAIGG